MRSVHLRLQSPQLESAERSSMIRNLQPRIQVKRSLNLPRAQERTLQLIIVVCGPESVLPDVLAMDTIEMIPKSMILTGMMMMKFMFNVAAISWMMSDSRMGLVLVYNALGLMSNNVSLYVYTREVALCTGSSMYICPNSLLYIYTG